MSAVGPLVSVLRLNTRLFQNCLEGVSDERAVERPNGATNSLAFLGCHLADSRFFVAAYLGLDVVNPFAELLAEARTIEDIGTLPTVAHIRQVWQAASADMEAAMASLGQDDVRAPSPQRFPVDDPTVLGGLGFMIQHESYHIGQMALLRKYFGYPAMSYK